MRDVDFATVVARRWPVLLIAGLLGGALAFAGTSLIDEKYEARADLLVGPVNSDLSLEASGALARTYEELAHSRSALRSAAQAADVDIEPAEFRRSLTTSSNSVTRIVSLTVENSRPDTAADLANALATRLTRVANETPARAEAALDEFGARLGAITLSQEEQVAVLEAARLVFGAATAGRLSLIERATPSQEPSSPPVSFITTIGVMVGVLIAALLAYLTAGGFRRGAPENAFIRGDRALTGAVHLPPEGRTGWQIVSPDDPSSVAAEEYKLLAARVAGRPPPGSRESLLLVGATDSAVPALVAANLARALSRESRRVLLVDLDPARALTELFGLEESPGYAELASERGDSGTLEARAAELCFGVAENLAVLPFGLRATRAMGQARAGRILQGLTAQADQVVLVGAPVVGPSMALTWANATDSTLLVVAADRDGRDDIDHAVQVVSQIGGRFAGTVVGRQGTVVPFAERSEPRSASTRAT